jgi:hypothetical protein
MPPPPPAGELKTINVDLNLFGLPGASKTPKARGRSTPRRQSTAQSDGPSAKDIATKSAELQAAVEEALSSASTPRPFPRTPSSTDAPSKRPQLHTSPPPSLAENNVNPDVKVVVSELGGPPQVDSTLSTATEAPQEEGIGSALKELNALMARRVQRRLMKTQRAQMERDKTGSLPSSVASTSHEQAVGDAGGQTYKPHEQPKWGNLKNGKLPTYRKYSKTMRANKSATKQDDALLRNPGGEATRGVSFGEQHETSTAAPAKPADAGILQPNRQDSKSQRKKNEQSKMYSVGKQKSGKIGLILNPESLSKTRRNKRVIEDGGGPRARRTITARNKMRKAGLLTGGANVPQRLIDTMCSAVDQIGVVKRTE